ADDPNNLRRAAPPSFTRRLTLPLAVLLVWMARRRSGALPRGHAVGDRAFFRDVRIVGKDEVEFLSSLDDHEVGQERDTGDIDDRECRVDLARSGGGYVVGALGGRAGEDTTGDVDTN